MACFREKAKTDITRGAKARIGVKSFSSKIKCEIRHKPSQGEYNDFRRGAKKSGLGATSTNGP